MKIKKTKDVVNFYTVMSKKLLVKTKNPNFKVHGINLPFRMVIVGGSGSMKTNSLLNLLFIMPDTFMRVDIITKNRDEPLYNFLSDKIKDGLKIHEGLRNLPDVDEFDKKDNSLIVLDDLCLEKDQSQISDFFIRARKVGCSVVYLTQSWFKVPTVIRQNLTHIILKRIGSTRVIKAILKDYTLGVSVEQLLEIYNFALKEKKEDFFMIDLDEADEKRKFRRNYDVIELD